MEDISSRMSSPLKFEDDNERLAYLRQREQLRKSFEDQMGSAPRRGSSVRREREEPIISRTNEIPETQPWRADELAALALTEQHEKT